LYILTNLSGYPLQHLANASILASSSGQTEPFPCLKMLSTRLCFFWPTQQHVICLNDDSYFTHSTGPFTTRGLNTFIQVNIMGAQHNMYIRNGHIDGSQLFFLCFLLTPGQASWLRTSMSGTVKNCKLAGKCPRMLLYSCGTLLQWSRKTAGNTKRLLDSLWEIL
jgi:hypothetical protein